MTLSKTEWGDWEIAYVKTDPLHRGKGFASILLKRAKAIADEVQIPLIAFIDPDKSGGLTYEQEEEWLKRHGFKKEKYDFGEYKKPVMIYAPVR